MAARSDEKISEILQDPSSTFDDPMDVVASQQYSLGTKRDILRQWELDARELLVAEEESMTGGEPAMLDRVLEALRTLGVDTADEPETDTKLG